MENYLLGRIGKTHGLKGELKFSCPEENAIYLGQVLSDNLMCWVKTSQGTFPVYIEYFRSDGFILKLKHVDNVEDAKIYCQGDVLVEDLGGAENLVIKDALEDAMIVLEDGKQIGRIRSIEEYPAHDMAIVQYGDKEILIPMVDEFFVDFIIEKKELVLRLPDGILDLNK